MGSGMAVLDGCQMRNAFLVGVGVSGRLVVRDCPVKSEYMALERMCIGSKGGVDGEGSKKGSGGDFL